ncbi:glycosyltransferase family 2 protein [Sedimentisphaera salicampi]|uniref:glycosyltransferase family 2 protein n=1 Tax=Sedimentisphaera salicampi TaxID=1941349 RepID=UPI000B9C6A07|nr:glycosyltransferase family 2 protein [Sedimentisphaera salicampi]OXU15282.1 GalNAc(5)-diNAcBac-PP-undecaprenol beta-1,3-glucosyltransferase [Sedimentisphaera salicampi]
MSEKPKISVIIPAYNNAETISRAVKSALNQTLEPLEVIVVDDCSTDNTSEVLKSTEDRIRFIQRQHNGGPGAARNDGINAMKGEWASFLDGDDEWYTEKLEIQARFLKRNPELLWCGTNYIIKKDGRERTPVRKIAGELKGEYFSLMNKGLISSSTITIMIKADVFEVCGLFKPEVYRNEDRDLYWRIAMDFPEYGFINKPLSVQHMGRGSEEAMAKRAAAKDGRYLFPLIDSSLENARLKGRFEDFKPFAGKIVRNAMLSMVFLELWESFRKAEEKYSHLLPFYERAALSVCRIFPFCSPAMRAAYRVLRVAGLAGSDRFLDYWKFIKANGLSGEEEG